VILRFGTVGTYEDYLGPAENMPPGEDTLEETFTPMTSGELFLSVNDVALPLWGHDLFYRNNQVEAMITLKHL